MWLPPELPRREWLQALLLGTADDGVLERALEELGHDGEDIYSHVGIYLLIGLGGGKGVNS